MFCQGSDTSVHAWSSSPMPTRMPAARIAGRSAVPLARRPLEAGCHDIDAPPAAACAMISGVVWMKCPKTMSGPRAPASR